MHLQEYLKVKNHSSPVKFEVLQETVTESFRRQLIRYRGSENDWIPAYLFIPLREGPHAAVVVHHQHNGERHLGKSEVAGLAGHPLQAFAPALASLGFVVLAPDSICFEDRRTNKQGIEPDTEEMDWLQHFNQMSYRLVKGDTLMRKILEDASIGLSLLAHLPFTSANKLGVLGHSYGGNTALFQAAIDKRVQFTCSSGAVCSYKRKMEDCTGLEMALTIPGFALQFDFPDLVRAIAPRKILVVSADRDKYSQDADQIVQYSLEVFERSGFPNSLVHKRYHGSHSLTQERFDFIVNWISSCGFAK